MRRSLLSVPLFLLLAVPAVSETQPDRVEYPLAKSEIALRQSTMVFRARWAGSGTLFNPRLVSSVVSVSEAGGEASAIPLLAKKWKALRKGKGFKYKDRAGVAGGIRSIVLRVNGQGGVVRLKARGRNFPFRPAGTPSDVSVTLSIGTARWCADFAGPFQLAAKGMVASSDQAPESCPCASSANATWPAIQVNVIARYGCTAAACHSGPAPQGGLDLSPEVAYRNLVGVRSQANPDLERVKRADRTHSVFWLKLARKTLPGEYENTVGGSPMPSNDLTLTKEELEAVRLWIQNGAPETGVVEGTDRLLSACLPAPDPIKIAPPAAPAPADGVQFYGPPWAIPPRGENEICQATYFDFSDQIPESVKLSKDDPLCHEMWGGNRDCFYANHIELTQDPNSHHSIIHIYRGASDYGKPEYTQGFGPFTCRTGERAGQPCDPGGSADQCPGSVCAGRIQGGVNCIFYGPPDYGFDATGAGTNNAPTVGGSQQPYQDLPLPAGVYTIYPVKGTMVWNSHAFNTTAKPTTNEQYLNVFFAKDAADRLDPVRPIFDQRYIFTQDVPPFEKREYCATFTLPKGARVGQLSSHNHKRGVLFRIWTPPNASCGPCDPPVEFFGGGCRNPNPACTPNARTPLALTTTYNDPVQYFFGPPLMLDADDDAGRTFKYCVVYDNGFRDPAEVKRQSTSPRPPLFLAPGGPCGDATVACANEGPNRGKLCNGDDRQCDSPGETDGDCDACPLRGGVTTEDEMDILIGDWYCPGSLEKNPLVCPGR